MAQASFKRKENGRRDMIYETFATIDFVPITIMSKESPISERVWVKDLRAKIELQKGGPELFVSDLNRFNKPVFLRCVILTDYEVMDNSGLWSALCNSTGDNRRIFDILSPVVKLIGCKVNWHDFPEESVIQYGSPYFPYASVSFPLMVDYYQYDEDALLQMVEDSRILKVNNNEPATGTYIDY